MPSIAAAPVETLATFRHHTTVDRVAPAFGPSIQEAMASAVLGVASAIKPAPDPALHALWDLHGAERIRDAGATHGCDSLAEVQRLLTGPATRAARTDGA